MRRNLDVIELKKAAARKALEYIEPGMIIGVGSGTTVREFTRLLAESKIDVFCLPTSSDTEFLLSRYGLRILSPVSIERVDIAVDGADSILLEKKVILKGGGGALTREKIVDYSARRLIIIADETKLNRTYPVVVEIVPFAYSFVFPQLSKFGEPRLRISKHRLGPVITDNGNWLIDITIRLDKIDRKLESTINSIPGVVENGIFTKKATVIVARRDGRVEEVDV